METSRRDAKGNVLSVLQRRTPRRVAYAPNYWQWFVHHRDHGLLPEEIKDCRTQLDLLHYLGVEVFSRNIYCDEREYWFGGLAETVWRDLKVEKQVQQEGDDKITEIHYHTRFGRLTERLRYNASQSSLVQEKFPIHDYEKQLDALEDLLAKRSWRFRPEKYREVQEKVGDRGVVIAGELYSPLKMLHLLAGPITATYMLTDYADRMQRLLSIHENAQLDLVRQMTEAGVRVMMSMDNLDTMFHPPKYVEMYSASFYEKTAALCHENGALFFIHACGKQRDNLALISSLGVDGLEGVAFPPLGDVELDEAMRKTGDAFLITGGISAIETDNLTRRQEVFEYVRKLLAGMKPYANRFIFSSSCNTSINASWDTIKYFRDAWMEYGVP